MTAPADQSALLVELVAKPPLPSAVSATSNWSPVSVVFSMNSEPSLVTPSAFSICPRTLMAAPLVSVQATTMSPLRSCMTDDRSCVPPATVALTVCWAP